MVIGSFSPASRRTRHCLETCQATGSPTCLIMEMATAACPGIAWHSGTASAACRRRCTSRSWVPCRPTSAAPCATIPCGSCTSGSRGRRTPGRRGSTATWPVPRPCSTCRTTPHRATPSPPHPPTARCPCTVATPRCDPTTWPAAILRSPPPFTDETRASIDVIGRSPTRSVQANKRREVIKQQNKRTYQNVLKNQDQDVLSQWLLEYDFNCLSLSYFWRNPPSK